jgi:K+-transporting ATPase KdpF subunit
MNVLYVIAALAAAALSAYLLAALLKPEWFE